MSKFGKISIISTSLLIPVTMLTSGFVAWQLRSNNPDNIDITGDLAYLRPILLTLLITVAVMWLLSLVTAILAIRDKNTQGPGKFALLLLVLVSIAGFLGAVVQNAAEEEVVNYRKAQQADYLRKLEKLRD